MNEQAVRYTGFMLLLAGLAGCAAPGEQAARMAWTRSEPARVTSGDPSPEPVRFGDGTLGVLLDRARTRSPEVRANRQRWKAALERIPQARALPDPTLTVGVFLQAVETRVGPQRERLGVSQSFPWFGTLGLRGEAAVQEAEAMARRVVASEREAVRRTVDVVADALHRAEAERIARETVRLVRGWEEILRTRYASGSVTYSDLLQVQVELGTLEDRVLALEQERVPIEARLRARLDLPASTTVLLPDSIPSAPPLEPREDLLAALRDSNPELAEQDTRIRRARTGVELAGRRGRPEFMVGLDWIRTDARDVPGLADNGKDPLLAHVGIRVPLWRGSIAAGKREAQALVEAAGLHARALRNDLEARLDEMLFRYRDADRRVALYRDGLIPRGRQSLRASFSAFGAGEASFLQLLDVQRTLLEFELARSRAEADRLAARASIDELLGRSVPWEASAEPANGRTNR